MIYTEGGDVGVTELERMYHMYHDLGMGYAEIGKAVGKTRQHVFNLLNYKPKNNTGYPQLQLLMWLRNVNRQQIADLLDINIQVVRHKLLNMELTQEEKQLIQETYFPDFTIGELYKTYGGE